MDKSNGLPKKYSIVVDLPATPERAFEYLDDPNKLSSHMGKSSWMMAGSKMTIAIDQQGGKAVGSEITMNGKMMGIRLFLREVIVEREPPKRKVWQTIGPQALIIIDQYRMGFELAPSSSGSALRVFIEYSLPPNGIKRVIGWCFAKMYAKWCTKMMAKDTQRYFQKQ